MENQVQNYGLKWTSNDRKGRMVDIPKKSDSALGNKLKDQSLTLRGGQVFNSLPIYLRNSTNITLDTFKSRLDRFLEQIPDNPPIPEPIRSCKGKHSNSIQDWIVFLKLGDRRSVTGNNEDLFRP